MQNLFDFLTNGGFSGQGVQRPAVPGLLTPDDSIAVRNRGLLGMAQGLLSSSGWSNKPVGFGEALGNGLGGMMQAQDAETENAMKRNLYTSQLGAQQAKAQVDKVSMMTDLAKAFTPESQQEFLKTGDPTVLRKIVTPITLTPGSQMVNPESGKVIAAAPTKQQFKYMDDGTVIDEATAQVVGKVPVGLSPAQQIQLAQQGQQIQQFGVNTELKLADDYRADSKTYGEIKRQATIIEKSLDDPSAAGTLAAATSFMKLLDPGSVVRESELGMAMAAEGAFSKLANYFNIIENGKVLTQGQKEDFKRLTKQYVQAAEESQRNVNSRYTERAQSYGLNPRNVVTYDVPSAAPTQPTQITPKSNGPAPRLRFNPQTGQLEPAQ